MATAPKDGDGDGSLKGGRLILAAFSLALANFIVVLDTTVANVSVPHIAGGLAVSPTQGTWAITSYAVADAISVPLTGWLSSRFGAVRWFLTSLVGFALFSFLCGVSSSLNMLILFRVLQGLSGGPLMPLTQTLLLRIFPKKRAPVAMSIWAMTTTTAPIVGPILGGTISDTLSWPWIFFINLPIVAVSWLLVSRLLPAYETVREKRRIDVVGLVLLVLAVGAFQIMLDTGREHDWFASPGIVALAIVAAIGFAAFIVWELTDANPIVDIRVFGNRGFTAGTLALSLGFGSYFASIVLTPLWLQQTVGYTATEAGFTVAWSGVLAVVLSPFAARLGQWIDIRWSMFLGIVWLGATSLLRTRYTTGGDYWTFAIPQLVQGMGMPFFFIGASTLAIGNVDPKRVANAAGLMSFTRTLSGAIGTALATTLWDNATRASRADMVGRLNGADAAVTGLTGAGFDAGGATAVLERLVDAQAATVGAVNVYITAAIAFGVAAACVWLAPRPRAVAPGAAH